jgi:hypothetical protein
METDKEGGSGTHDCMFLTTLSNLDAACLGCVGSKGEKFCTKAKIGKGEQDTCGVNSHTKKAIVKAWHIFYADGPKQQGYVSPSLHNDYNMASSVWDMRSEDITRVQFRELADLVKTQAVTTKEELLDAKTRVLNPAKGVSFTPRKNPGSLRNLRGSTPRMNCSPPLKRHHRRLKAFKTIL